MRRLVEVHVLIVVAVQKMAVVSKAPDIESTPVKTSGWRSAMLSA